MVNHGNGVYWKGVAHEGPNYKPIAEAHQRITEIFREGKFVATAIYEWVPLQKINSIPANKMAYRRIPNPNCLIVVGWPGTAHSEGKVSEARPLAHGIAACIVGGLSQLKDVKSQGYSNYGTVPLSEPFHLLHRFWFDP